MPAIVLGDLNDVAWSPTTQQFMKAGHLLDPRRGRGFYNTYPARWPGLRYPLDYVFCTRHFLICSMKVPPPFDSDQLHLDGKGKVVEGDETYFSRAEEMHVTFDGDCSRSVAEYCCQSSAPGTHIPALRHWTNHDFTSYLVK